LKSNQKEYKTGDSALLTRTELGQLLELEQGDVELVVVLVVARVNVDLVHTVCLHIIHLKKLECQSCGAGGRGPGPRKIPVQRL
jgi:hypothetical protein